MRRTPKPPTPDRREPWQIAQGKACGCGGSDDMCACQNENPWPRAPTHAQREAVKAAIRRVVNTGFDTYEALDAAIDREADAIIAYLKDHP